MPGLPPTVEVRLRALPMGLRDHIQRVRETARALAERHGVDAAKVDLAAAAHDLARSLEGDAVLKQARLQGLRLHPVELHTPLLLHGPVAARWLEREDGISNKGVLEAVRWHTTGSAGMGLVAKVVFLADKLEPRKLSQYPHLAAINSVAQQSLDQALLEFLDLELAYLVRQRQLIHPASVELRNELRMAGV